MGSRQENICPDDFSAGKCELKHSAPRPFNRARPYTIGARRDVPLVVYHASR